jgi:hypothetical protein
MSTIVIVRGVKYRLAPAPSTATTAVGDTFSRIQRAGAV